MLETLEQNIGPNMGRRELLAGKTMALRQDLADYLGSGFKQVAYKGTTLLAAVGLLASACVPVAAPPAFVEAQKDSQASSNTSFCSDSEIIPVLDSDKTITRAEYKNITEQLLRRSDPFVGGKSFTDIMQGFGNNIGRLEPYCPGFTFQANEIGSLRRLRPAPVTESSHNVPLMGLEIYQGEWFKAYWRFSVTNPANREVTYFSVAEAQEPTKGVAWPTFVREGDEQLHVRPYKPYVTPVLSYLTVPVDQFPTNRTRASNHH